MARSGEVSVRIVPDASDFPRRVEALLRRMSPRLSVGLDLDSQSVQRLRRLAESQLRRIRPEIRATISVDERRVQRDLNRIARRLTLRVPVILDTAGIRAQLAALQRLARITIRVDADTRGARSQINDLGRVSGRLTGFASALPGVVALTTAVGALGGAVGLAGGAVGALGIGFAGLAAVATPAIAAIALGADGIKAAAERVRPALDGLKASVSAAFEQSMAPGFERVSALVSSLSPQMTVLASTIGGTFSSLMANTSGLTGSLQAMVAGAREFVSAMGPGLQATVQGFVDFGATAAQSAGQMGSAFGSMLGAIGAKFSELAANGTLTNLFSGFAGVLQAIGPLLANVVQTFATLANAVMPALAPVLGAVGQTLAGISGPLGNLGASLGQALAPLLPIVGQIVGLIATGLAPILPVVSSALQAVGNVIAQALPTAIPVFQQLVGVAGQLLAAIAPLLPPLISLVSAVLTPIIGIVGQVVAAFAPFISQLAAQLQPVIAGIAPILAQVGQTLAGALVQALSTVAPLFGPLVGAFGQLLSALLPLLPPIANLAGKILPLMAQYAGLIIPVVTQIISLFANLASAVVPIVASGLNMVANLLGSLLGPLQNLGSVWGTVMGGIRDGVSGAAQWVTDKLGQLIDFVKGLPGRIANAASGMWDGLKDAFKAAINWIIQGWNSLDFKVPGVHIGPINFDGFTLGVPDLPLLADGGVARRDSRTGRLSGPGTGTSDSLIGVDEFGRAIVRVSADETVVTAKASADPDNAAAMTAMNRGHNIVDYVARLAGLALGGPVRAASEINEFPRAQGLEGAPYVWGGTHWGDCSGAMSAIARFAVNLSPWGGRFSTASEAEQLESMGFTLGRGSSGDLRIGWVNGGAGGGHTAGTLPNDTRVEMGGSRGNGQVGGGAAGADDAQFTDHAYLAVKPPPSYSETNPYVPKKAGPDTAPTYGATPTTPTTTTPTTSAPTAESTWSGLASTAVSGYVGDTLKVFGIGDELPGFVKAIDMVVKDPGTDKRGDPGMARGYDTGGWLPPTPKGYGAFFNHSGKPEPVLTWPQWSDVSGVLSSLTTNPAAAGASLIASTVNSGAQSAARSLSSLRTNAIAPANIEGGAPHGPVDNSRTYHLHGADLREAYELARTRDRQDAMAYAGGTP